MSWIKRLLCRSESFLVVSVFGFDVRCSCRSFESDICFNYMACKEYEYSKCLYMPRL